MKSAPGVLGSNGSGAAADIAEHKRGAGPGRRGDRVDRAVDPCEGHFGLRHLQHQQREGEGDKKPDDDRPPRHRAAVLADGQAKAMMAKTPSADCRFCMMDEARCPLVFAFNLLYSL